MKKLRLYQTVAILLLIIAIVTILYFGRIFLLPLTLAALISMLLTPLANKFDSWGLNKGISITFCMLIFSMLFITILGLISIQLASMSDQMPEIKKEVHQLIERSQSYVSEQFNIDREAQNKRIRKFVSNAKSAAEDLLGNGISMLSSTFLTFIYIILFLVERQHLYEFALKISSREKKAKDIIDQSMAVAIQYLTGKGLTMLLLAILYAIGFALAGIPFSWLLAIIGAALSIIPYVGNLIGGSIAILLTILGGGGFNGVMWVVIIISSAQLLESYVLEPLIVGDRVNINPLTTIAAVVGFGIMWGAVGAIIAIPITGIVKIVFDNFKSLNPLGFLLGQD